MPNWCANDLIVTGNAKDIARFKKKAASLKTKMDGVDVEFCFEPFIPMPKALVNTKSPCEPNKKFLKLYGASSWYDWKLSNLGTKWDVGGELTVDEKTRLGYTFSSAWSPPEIGVVKISALYPKLQFTLIYDEPGMDFAGELTVKAGEVVRDLRTKSIINKECQED